MSARKANSNRPLKNRRQQIKQLKDQRKDKPKHIEVKDLPEQDRFQRLRSEKKKHFIDTIKLIAYRAENGPRRACPGKRSNASMDGPPPLIRQTLSDRDRPCFPIASRKLSPSDCTR